MSSTTRSQRGYTGRGQAFRLAVMDDRRGGDREQPLWEETHRLRVPTRLPRGPVHSPTERSRPWAGVSVRVPGDGIHATATGVTQS